MILDYSKTMADAPVFEPRIVTLGEASIAPRIRRSQDSNLDLAWCTLLGDKETWKFSLVNSDDPFESPVEPGMIAPNARPRNSSILSQKVIALVRAWLTNVSQAKESQQSSSSTSERNAAIVRSKELVAKHFKVADSIMSADANDPETGEEYAEINFRAKGEIDDVLASYRQFTTEWIRDIPDDVRRNLRIVYSVE
jgi:hypothetical protein